MNSKKTPTDEQLRDYLIQQIDIELSKPIGEQDMEYIDECNAFLKQVGQDQYMPDPDRKQLEIAKLRQKIAEQAGLSVSRKGYRFKRTAILLCAVVALLTASILVTSAVSQITPLEVIEKWGSAIFNLPYDKEVSENGITFIRNGNAKSYPSLEKLTKQEGLNILTPTWLPDNVRIEKIIWLESEPGTRINFKFNTENVQITIRLDEDYYKEMSSTPSAVETNVKEFRCYLFDHEMGLQLIFTDCGLTYIIVASDVEMLIKLTEGMK